MLAIRFVGGNHSAAPSQEWSNRDGIGASVKVETPRLTLVREHRAGDGLAAQKTSTMFIGLGTDKQVNSLTIRWPSSRVQTVENLKAGSLVTVYENSAQSPSREPFVIEPYRLGPVRPALPHRLTSLRYPSGQLNLLATTEESTLRMFTTMATWCPFCKFWHPQVRNLASAFGEGELQTYGVPVDQEDTKEKLQSYVQEYRPAYTLLTDLTQDQVDSVKQMTPDLAGQEVLPTTIVTDATGHLLYMTEGVPSVSDIGRLIREQALSPLAPPAIDVSFPLRLNFGEGATRRWIGSGWHQDESAEGKSYVWSDGLRSVLEVPSPRGGDIQMTLECHSFLFPDNPQQSVSIALNGTMIEQLALRPNRHKYTVILPKEALLDPINIVEFRYAYARRPQHVLPDSSDDRLLAVAWYSIDFAELDH